MGRQIALQRLAVSPSSRLNLNQRGLATVVNSTSPSHPLATSSDGVKVETFLLEDLAPTLSPDGLKRLPQFTISRKAGFLPREDPLVTLPPAFDRLDSLLKRMTIKQYDPLTKKETGPGLLAQGQYGDAVLSELKVNGPEVQAVDKAIASGDQRLLSALFRDYCFATSAYLFEPTDISYRKTGLYSPGRDVLPAQLAVPLKKLADALGHQPFMEYASSYALVNYKFRDLSLTTSHPEGKEAGRYSFPNLDLIRSFQDPYGSERGFIAVHITMVSFSGQAVSSTEDILAAAIRQDLPAVEAGMESLLNTYRKINAVMESMWGRSKPSDYLSFRTFIFGTAPKKGNPMFPQGVRYEGVREEPFHLRGESGANDSLVPLLDNLLEITASLPKNELTDTLREFRSYRPATQREYINLLEYRARHANIKSLCLDGGSAKAKALYLLLVDQVREFRHRHWLFAREYIIKQTKFPLATGGSAMLSYLPHNLRVVLEVLAEGSEAFTEMDATELARSSAEGEKLLQDVQAVRARAKVEARVLEREVEGLRRKKEEDDRLLKEGEKQTTGYGMVTSQHVEKRDMGRGMVGCDGVG